MDIPNRSPDVPPSWSTRPFLLLEAGAGRLPGPGPALAPDRNPAVPLGAAAEAWQDFGLLLGPPGPGGRLGSVEVLGRVNPRALWTAECRCPWWRCSPARSWVAADGGQVTPNPGRRRHGPSRRVDAPPRGPILQLQHPKRAMSRRSSPHTWGLSVPSRLPVDAQDGQDGRPPEASHSRSFDHRCRFRTPRTAMATAFFWGRASVEVPDEISP
jgi:hypothetical protein